MSLLLLKWFKNNWVILSFFTVILTGSLFISKEYYEIKQSSLEYKHAQQMMEQSASHCKIVEKLNQVMLDNIEKQKILSLEYQSNLENLQHDYEAKMLEIEKVRKVKTEELAKEINNNPDGALKKIAEEYGLEIVITPVEE